MEFKSVIKELHATEDKNVFKGYGSTFGNKDADEDIIEKGAFKKTLKEHKERIKILWQHNVTDPIGVPILLEEDSKGLYIEGKLSETDSGKKAMQLIKDKVITEMSIGYRTVKQQWDNERKARRLKELKLYEISLVTFGANEMARVTGAKSLENMVDDILFLTEKNKTSFSKEKINNAINALKTLLDETEPSQDTQDTTKSLEDKSNQIDKSNFNYLLEEIQKYKN